MTLFKPSANHLLCTALNLCYIPHISVLFKEITTVVFQTNYAYKNTLLSPKFTIRTGQCCTMLLILIAFPHRMTLLEIPHSTLLAPFHPIKSSCVILFWNIFHILKDTSSKTSQSTTSHKVHTTQVEFEVPKATKMTIFQDVALCSFNHSNNNIPNHTTLRPRRWQS